MFGQTTCLKITWDVHLRGQKHRMTTKKPAMQQPQLQIYVFYVCQPSYFLGCQVGVNEQCLTIYL